MDLEKGNLTKNLNGVTPLSYKSTDEKFITTSTANLYSSNDISTNGTSSEKNRNSRKFIILAIPI